MNILLVLSGVLFLLLITGGVYQTIGAARDARRFPAPGRLVDVGGHRLHLHRMGEGHPTVVMESGIAASSLSWSLVQPAVATFTRVCTYDRAGLGWSDSGRLPPTTTQLAEQLHLLLVNAGIPAPYVMVGHSFGGFITRAYASKYPVEVAGMVLIDPLHPSEWSTPSEHQRRTLRGGVLLSRLGAVLARLGVVRLCLALLSGGSPGAPRLFIKVFGPRTVAFLLRIVGEVTKLPREILPIVQALWCQPKCFEGMARHLASLPESAAQLAATGELGEMPLVVLSASNQAPDRALQHVALARLSSSGRRIVVPDSGHWIQLDQPEVVSSAIRDVVDSARLRSAAVHTKGPNSGELGP